jgi:hypothetical protein
MCDVATTYRLIKAAPADPAAVLDAFEALATRTQNRDGCDRVAALQRAVDENPDAYAAYCCALTKRSAEA